MPRRRRSLRVTAGLRVDTRKPTTRLIGDSAGETAESINDPLLQPLAIIQGSLGLWNLHAGIWYAERGGSTADFPGRDHNFPLIPGQDDHQRYGALSYELRRHTYGIAVAWRPAEWLGIGVAAAAQWITLTHERVLWAGPAESAVPVSELGNYYDLRSRMDLSDGFVPMGLFGLFVRPWRPLRIGLSFEIGGEAELSGTATLRPSRDEGGVGTPPQYDETDATVRFQIPWVLRIGLGVDVGRVSLDAMASITGAESPAALVAETPGLLLERTSGPYALVPIDQIPLGIRFQQRVRLGVGLRVAAIRRHLTLALGYGYGQGATEPSERSAALVTPDQHLFSVGLVARYRAVQLSVAYARVHAIWRTGTSEAQLVNPVEPEATTGIGSGRQTLNGDLVSATLSLTFPYQP
ncbi:hypothetical protein ACFL51_01780 [Myxococcota bacterium]